MLHMGMRMRIRILVLPAARKSQREWRKERDGEFFSSSLSIFFFIIVNGPQQAANYDRNLENVQNRAKICDYKTRTNLHANLSVRLFASPSIRSSVLATPSLCLCVWVWKDAACEGRQFARVSLPLPHATLLSLSISQSLALSFCGEYQATNYLNLA